MELPSSRYPRTSSSSSQVVVRPKLNRTAPIPSSGGTPIAARMGERVTEPAWQADPVEAATPGSVARISAPTRPTKLRLRVLGIRSVGWPFSVTFSPNNPRSPSQNRSRRFFTCGIPIHLLAASHAAPRATATRTFSLPAPPPRLVPRPVDERLDLRPFPYVERPDPFRRVHLVPGHRKKVHARFLDVGGNLPHRLRRVRVERNTGLPCDGGDLGDRLDGPDLIVCVHDRDEDRLRGDRLPDILRIDHPVPVDRQDGDLGPERFQEPARFDRGRMLDGSGDDMVSPVPVGEEDPLDGMVVRFAPAAGKHDLGRVATEEARHLPARFLHRIFRW